MFHSRRRFLGTAIMLVAASAFPADGKVRQDANLPPVPSYPNGSLAQVPPAPRLNPQNQENIRKDVARLTEVVAELQKSLDGSDTNQMLPLDVIHKTDEVEKLAKQIKSLVKG